MEYRNLGATGLKISSLCMGTMTFGDGADFITSKTIYHAVRDQGINFFDCANVYAKGESERILGKLMQGHRDEVVIATKVYFPAGEDVNARGLSRKHMRSALDSSLKRLDTDYVDIYYLHHFDTETSLEETLRTLDDFVRGGKVLYIGISNFSAWQTVKAMGITKQMGLAPISCIQPMYNLLKRQAESEILPMAISENLGVFSYSPLAGGYLTGKYLSSNRNEGRFDTSKMYQNRYKDEVNLQAVEAFNNLAGENNLDPVALAIAWVAAHPAITAPIIGARNMDQLEAALKVLDFQLTDDLITALNNITRTPALATDREEERNS